MVDYPAQPTNGLRTTVSRCPVVTGQSLLLVARAAGVAPATLLLISLLVTVVDAAGPERAELNYEHLGMFAPDEPTADRPYYHYRFDANTQSSHPDFSPLDVATVHNDKLIILNFRDESFESGAVQDRYLRHILKPLAEASKYKEIMLVDIVARDAQQKNVYGAAYATLYDGRNEIGKDGQPLDTWMLPYGVVYGESLQDLTIGAPTRRLFDFALLNNPNSDTGYIQTNGDFEQNAKALHGRLDTTIQAYNQKYLLVQ